LKKQEKSPSQDPFLMKRWITPKTSPILHREFVRLQEEEQFDKVAAQKIIERMLFSASEEILQKRKQKFRLNPKY